MREHRHKQPEQKPEAPKPTSPAEGFKGENKLKVRAKNMVIIEGVTYHAGEEFELPERMALALVGSSNAEQIPPDAAPVETRED